MVVKAFLTNFTMVKIFMNMFLCNILFQTGGHNKFLRTKSTNI